MKALRRKSGSTRAKASPPNMAKTGDTQAQTPTAPTGTPSASASKPHPARHQQRHQHTPPRPQDQIRATRPLHHHLPRCEVARNNPHLPALAPTSELLPFL